MAIYIYAKNGKDLDNIFEKVGTKDQNLYIYNSSGTDIGRIYGRKNAGYWKNCNAGSATGIYYGTKDINSLLSCGGSNSGSSSCDCDAPCDGSCDCDCDMGACDTCDACDSCDAGGCDCDCDD